MPTPSLLRRLRQRKLVQWGLAYLAGAWVIYEATGTALEAWDIPVLLVRSIHVLLIVGFFLALVLAWYHGEKGRQRVSGPELLMVAALLIVAGGVLSMLGRGSRLPETTDQPAAEAAEDVAAALSRRPGIAVLPFKNQSGVPDDEYFTDGIQTDLLTRLNRLPELRIISRTSSDLYRETDLSVPEIGRELGVAYVVEGDVQRAGDQVRINVQLIDAVTDSHVWSEYYDETLTTENLFNIQTRIVNTVAAELGIELRQGERRRIARRSTDNLEAYDRFLRGQSLPNMGRTDEAISLYREAVELDPEFAGAYVVLARALSYGYQMGGRSEELATEARVAAERALDLAPESEDAQLAMGIYLYRVEQNFEAALDRFRRAAGTLVGDYDYHYFRGLTERRAGQWQRSEGSLRSAITVSPRRVVAWQALCQNLQFMRRSGDLEECSDGLRGLRTENAAMRFRRLQLIWMRDGTAVALEHFQEQDPTDLGVWEAWEIAMTVGRYEDALALVVGQQGVVGNRQYHYLPVPLLEAAILEALGQREAAAASYQEAADILEPLVAESATDARYHASLAWAYAGLGLRDAAVREARQAVESHPRERDALHGTEFLFDKVAVLAAVGEAEEALLVLEDLLSVPSRYHPNMLEVHYRLRPLQDEPGFKALMDRERDTVF